MFLWFPISINLQWGCVTTPGSWKYESWGTSETSFWTCTACFHTLFVCTFLYSQILANTYRSIWLQILYGFIMLYIYIYTFAPPPSNTYVLTLRWFDKTKINPSSWIDIACYKLMNIRTSCIHNLYFLISIDISLTYLLLQAISLNFKILLISNILIIDKRLLQKKTCCYYNWCSKKSVLEHLPEISIGLHM